MLLVFFFLIPTGLNYVIVLQTSECLYRPRSLTIGDVTYNTEHGCDASISENLLQGNVPNSGLAWTLNIKVRHFTVLSM